MNTMAGQLSCKFNAEIVGDPAQSLCGVFLAGPPTARCHDLGTNSRSRSRGCPIGSLVWLASLLRGVLGGIDASWMDSSAVFRARFGGAVVALDVVLCADFATVLKRLARGMPTHGRSLDLLTVYTHPQPIR
jgi:hypothetical protein